VRSLDNEYLDVKSLCEENADMAKAVEKDHVDRFLESLGERLGTTLGEEKAPDIDLTVEGIVDRIMGLSKRFTRNMEETLAELGLNYGEWKVLGTLVHSDVPHRRSPGWLSEHLGLSSGAMTNRLDQLEKAGLVRRLPDPNDRRALYVELTEGGKKIWSDAAEASGMKEQLVASALGEREKEQLNGLLRKLMLAFERLEGRKDKKEKEGEAS
jgi:DNA-binding MarR family transcriptional regulator